MGQDITLPMLDDGDAFRFRLFSGFDSTDTPIEFIKFGVPGGGAYQSPSPIVTGKHNHY